MSPFRRNFLVGLTILVALGILGWFTLQFGKVVAQPFAPKQMAVQFITDRADGLSNGSPVLYRGVEVGHVVDVRLAPGLMMVIVNAMVDESQGLPANTSGRVLTLGVVAGSAVVSLELTGSKPEGKLAAGAKIPTKFVGSELLPQEFTQLASDLSKVTRDLHKSNLFADMDEQVRHIGVLTDSLQSLVGDKDLQGGVKESVQNIRTASTHAAAVAERMDRFSARLDGIADQVTSAVKEIRSTVGKTDRSVDGLTTRLYDRLDQIAVLLKTAQGIAAKIDNGTGTAGAMVNDPRLYASLADTARELDLTIKDLKRLVEQWEQEGLSLKLK